MKPYIDLHVEFEGDNRPGFKCSYEWETNSSISNENLTRIFKEIVVHMETVAA